MWRINATYRFNGMKQREIFLRTGMTSKDIGNGGGINPFLNTFTTLMLEQNYLKLYESDYLTLGYRSEIVNGLTMELTSAYEYRKVLENTTDFSIINTSREYSDNIPDNSIPCTRMRIRSMPFVTRIMHQLLPKFTTFLTRNTVLMKAERYPGI